MNRTPNDSISIIVPNFNGEKYLPSIINVIRPYYNKGYEIILVDDGSNIEDRTCELFKKEFPTSIVIHQKNRGVAAARNTGANASTRNYLQFIDIDDSISNDKLAQQYRFAEINNLDVVYSDWQMAIKKNGNVELEGVTVSESQENIIYSLINGWWQPPHSYLIKKSAYLLVGGSDETLVNAQDFDLIVRLALHGCTFGYLPGNHSTYYRYVDEVSLARGSRKVYWKSYERSLDKCFAIADNQNIIDHYIASAFANKYFEVSRNVYKIDKTWAKSIISKVKTIYPNFKPNKESRQYRFIYQLLGHEIAEKMAYVKANGLL